MARGDLCDAGPLCAFRASFGALMLVHTVRLHIHGMYERNVMEPAYHFRYDLAPFIAPPSSADWARLHLLLLGISSTCVALGVLTRVASGCFAVAYAYFVLCERSMFNNHYYLYTLLALLLALAGPVAEQKASLARLVAAATARRRGSSLPQPNQAQPTVAWLMRLLRLQVCVVYWYAGVAKLNSDWVLHSQPMLSKLRYESATYHPPAFEPFFTDPRLARFVSIGGVFFDLGIVPLLMLRRCRPFALAVATTFHASNHLLWQLGEFPSVMIATNLVFFDELPSADWFRRGSAKRKRTAAATAAAAAADTASPGARVHPAVRALGLAYALVQLVLPLRPLLVARFDALDVVHTKSHSLLSWRMMAVTTRNFINATLYSEAMGATLVLTRTYNRLYLLHENGTRTPLPTLPNISLSPRQMGYMPYSATMVSQYARDAARAHGCSRKTGCKLVGDLWSGINGRPLQRFVDPSTNLARVRVPLTRRPEWVLPMIYEYGDAVWRARMTWLRSRLEPSGGVAFFFAERVGSVFAEAFPAITPFPARALLVPLDGYVELHTSAAEPAQPKPPKWEADGEADQAHVRMLPRSQPLRLPFGSEHSVHVISGPGGGGGTACWAYVFGIDPHAERAFLSERERERDALRADDGDHDDGPQEDDGDGAGGGKAAGAGAGRGSGGARASSSKTKERKRKRKQPSQASARDRSEL